MYAYSYILKIDEERDRRRAWVNIILEVLYSERDKVQEPSSTLFFLLHILSVDVYLSVRFLVKVLSLLISKQKGQFLYLVFIYLHYDCTSS